MMNTPSYGRPHPITGLSNGRLGMWLFLGSETMLFAALFSAYLMLQWGTEGSWPHHASSSAAGMIETLLLFGSTGLFVLAVRRLPMGQRSVFGWALAASSALALLFLALEVSEDAGLWHLARAPEKGTFFALYFLLTGLHALHVIGGLVANAWLGWGAKSPADAAPWLERGRCLRMYWVFVDAVWAILFVLFFT